MIHTKYLLVVIYIVCMCVCVCAVSVYVCVFCQVCWLTTLRGMATSWMFIFRDEKVLILWYVKHFWYGMLNISGCH